METINAVLVVENNVIGKETIQTINARNVYKWLEVGKDYSNWIKVQIDRARLVGNRDYVVFAQKGVNPSGGRPAIEYHLSLDAAKHIAMISGTEKGHQAREYFIEMEKKAKQQIQLPNFNDPVIAARAWADEVEKNRLLTSQLTKEKSLADLARATIVSADSEIQLQLFAKSVEDCFKWTTKKKNNLGRTELYCLLRNWNILTQSNFTTGYASDAGWSVTKQCGTFRDRYGADRPNMVCYITRRGQEYIVNKLLKHSGEIGIEFRREIEL